jgi:hypothetical protein
VINITNFTCQDKPPWPLVGPTEGPARGQVEGPPGGLTLGPARGLTAGPARGLTLGQAGPARRVGGRVADVAGLAAAVLLSWLAYIPRRLGDRLFSWNDTEAYWRGWQITKVHGGLGRRYRNPRFGTLTSCPQCLGGGISTEDTSCLPCLGTGRISTEEVS